MLINLFLFPVFWFVMIWSFWVRFKINKLVKIQASDKTAIALSVGNDNFFGLYLAFGIDFNQIDSFDKKSHLHL